MRIMFCLAILRTIPQLSALATQNFLACRLNQTLCLQKPLASPSRLPFYIYVTFRTILFAAIPTDKNESGLCNAVFLSLCETAARQILFS